MIEALRRWAKTHTIEGRYTPVGVAFHWIIAALVLFQLWWGWRAGRMAVGADKIDAYELHAAVGLLILFLTAARILWRAVIPGPVNDADSLGWQTTASRVTHLTFYVCLVGLPLSGWALISATAPNYSLSVAGVLPVPHMPFETLPSALRWSIEETAQAIHLTFVLALLALIPVHVGAALQHHFIHRHDVLTAMVPGLEQLEEQTAAPAPPRRRKVRRSPKASSAR